MASAIPLSLMARRLPGSVGVETWALKPGCCQAFSGMSSTVFCAELRLEWRVDADRQECR